MVMDRLEEIKCFLNEKTIYVISCGSNAKEFESDFKKLKSDKNGIILCIKSAYKFIDGACDLFFTDQRFNHFELNEIDSKFLIYLGPNIKIDFSSFDVLVFHCND